MVRVLYHQNARGVRSTMVGNGPPELVGAFLAGTPGLREPELALWGAGAGCGFGWT